MKMKKRAILGAAALAMGLFGISSAGAAVITLLQWAPVPSDPTPEIVYTAGVGLATGPGAIGNGDGNLPPAGQTPGGLETDTVVTAPIPFSFNSSIFTGGTGYYDTTLTFTGMAPAGPAIQIPIGPANEDIQPLGPGTFTLTSTAPSGAVLLMSGTITGANLITGVDGSTSSAQLDGNGVNYTGGLILANAPLGSVAAGNSMAISMTALTPPLGVVGGVLQTFHADASGLFDINVVPEPASIGLIGVGLLMLKRRRKQ
jgi:hypothetical protein